jgi:uncharacterized protein
LALRPISHLTLRGAPPALQWGMLLGATAASVAAFEFARLPAALLLGAIAAAIGLSWFEARVKIPPWAFVIAQGFVGCLIARAITPAILKTILGRWPMFLFLIGAVIVFAAALGVVLARWKILPGTTAVWGSSPGAATAMVLMADAYGGDIQLVAVMQYLRVACVGLAASLVARAWTAHAPAAPLAIEWFPPLEPVSFLATLALGAGGAILGLKLRIPAGALLVPLFVGAPLAATHLIAIALPPWLLAIAYALVGWSIGFRFTREMVVHAARQLPTILASILTLIAMCGALAFALHEAAGTDALTAYLATSPGGADAVAIIAASTPVDVPFVMAMQVGRLLIVILVGPTLARAIARLTVGAEPASKAQRSE